MRILDRVVSYVEVNLEHPLTVNTLAQLVRLSPAHFSRVFKEEFGRSPGQYVRWRRVEAAMTLMRTTRQPLSAIALISGHADQSHLTRAFSRLVGISPARWRAGHARAQACSEPPQVGESTGNDRCDNP